MKKSLLTLLVLGAAPALGWSQQASSCSKESAPVAEATSSEWSRNLQASYARAKVAQAEAELAFAKAELAAIEAETAAVEYQLAVRKDEGSWAAVSVTPSVKLVAAEETSCSKKKAEVVAVSVACEEQEKEGPDSPSLNVSTFALRP